MSCSICGDRGIKENGSKCTCIISKELIQILPPSLNGIKVSHKVLEESVQKIDGKNILWTCERSKFKQILKSYLVYKYIQKGGRYKFFVLTGNELVTTHLTGEIETTLENIEQADFLCLELGFDIENRIMPQMLAGLLTKRLDTSLPTWIYIPLEKKQKMPITYGQDFFTLATGLQFLNFK